MPLFSRVDGDLVRDEPPLRRLIPYVMRSRNESLVFHSAKYRVGTAVRLLEALNRTRASRATFFEYFLWALARALHARPRMNRFVSGGRLYQRRKVFLSFVAMARSTEGTGTVTVKLDFPEGESFLDCATRISRAVDLARAGRGSMDGELALASRLPGVVLRAVMAVLRWCDRLNVLPGRLIASDPLFASAFTANLGSLGLSDTSHHLYEHGTAGIFAVLGRLAAGTVSVNWTFDERISEGHECVPALQLIGEILEHPEPHLLAGQLREPQAPLPSPGASERHPRALS